MEGTEKATSESSQGLPLNFGKRLAHTDKVVRDRGFKTLKKWLQNHPDLERLDYMKLWKGLYFGMWMADKRPVQQELSVNVALLLNDVPREKRNMWIDAFWETMRDAWEKLDVHRINKYLLFMRIILAESFKDLRVGGWQLLEVKERAEILAQSVPKLTNSAPSVGIAMQLARLLWEELLPQLGQLPRASEEVIMAFLEPFVSLAEWSYVEGLVRSIHEHVLRKAPPELQDAILKRVLQGAAKAEIPQKSREALYDTADELEKAARLRPEVASPLLVKAITQVAKAKSPSPKVQASADSEVKGKKKKKKVRGKKQESKSDGRLVMSPLMLPKAALPVAKASTAAPAGKKRSAKAAKTKKAPPSSSGGELSTKVAKEVKRKKAAEVNGEADSARRPKLRKRKA
eukprot:TRINITY_DN28361_c0_g1_i1.p1 TRINITY_DN28361_c0_g1~~TRINITY_DN28361_c0_g1_i1.p1  ORF type:complete len:415 (+),score=108.20 TRINITY_DN28361_c0_g1_i1:40-1245(+)